MRPTSLAQRRDQDDQCELPFPFEAAPPANAQQADSKLSSVPQPAKQRPRSPHKGRPSIARARINREKKPPAQAKLLPDSKLLVSREEAAQMLSISVRGVDYLIATKRLYTRRIGTRVLIPIEDVRKFARSDHPERLAG